MAKLQISKRNGKHMGTIVIDTEASVDELKEAFYRQFHYYPERQRFTIGDAKGRLLEDGKLKDYGLEDGKVLVFKDLGVQISWRLVFVLEYLGPIIICPFLYHLQKVVYSETFKHNLTQRLGLFLICAHFIKREFESLFIHRFSNATMPLHRLPVNCGHYWILCGLMIGYYLFHPKYQAPFESKWINFGLTGLILVFEFLNLQSHIVLRNLRQRGSKDRGIPYGWGFDKISCANYFWETCVWVSFSILVGCLTSWIFTAAAVGQMAQWAQKKHRRYLREFKSYPRRYVMIPPLF